MTQSSEQDDLESGVVRLFHRNPGLVDTVEGVARKIGRRTETLRPVIDKLVGDGMLVKRRLSGFEAISGDIKACEAFLLSRGEIG